MEWFMDGNVFGFSNDLGEVSFVIEGSDALVHDESGLYAKQPKVDREVPMEVVEVLNDVFDHDIVVRVSGMVSKYCPWAFGIGDDVFGIDIELRRHDLSDKEDLHVPAERISPGSLTWPKDYYVEVSADGSVYITSFDNILKLATKQMFVDIKKRLYVVVPKKYWFKIY